MPGYTRGFSVGFDSWVTDIAATDTLQKPVDFVLLENQVQYRERSLEVTGTMRLRKKTRTAPRQAPDLGERMFRL